MTIRLIKLREMSLSAKLATLAAVEAAALAVAAPVAWFAQGRFGILAAAIAAFSCLLGGSLALAICGLFRDPRQAFVGVLLGMLFGMGLPLAVGVGCRLAGGALAEAGVMFYLLFFFPITLTVKTVLSLPNVPSRATLENGRAV